LIPGRERGDIAFAMADHIHQIYDWSRFPFFFRLSLLPFSHPSLYHVTSRLVITAYGTGIYKWGKPPPPEDQLAPPLSFRWPSIIVSGYSSCVIFAPSVLKSFPSSLFSYRSSERFFFGVEFCFSSPCFFCSDPFFLISVVFFPTYSRTRQSNLYLPA